MMVEDWIDIHAHYYPPEPVETHRARLQGLQQGCWCVDQAPGWSAERTLAVMDRTGIAMQMLSNIPKTLSALRASNDYGASLVRAHPDRFGLLAALPTDDASSALTEYGRARDELDADGLAVTFDYNGVLLSDGRLEPLWAALDEHGAVVFAHPNAYGPGSLGRPCVLLEVAFETARVVTDMLYRGVFRRHPNIRFVIAHCGGALPALSGRLELIGLQDWVPNPHAIRPEEVQEHLSRLFVDTAATMPTALAPALVMTGIKHVVYGSDCGVPCTNDDSIQANIRALSERTGLSPEQVRFIGRNALSLFPKAALRIQGGYSEAESVLDVDLPRP